MHRTLFAVLFACLAPIHAAMAENLGRYVGLPIQTEWLDNGRQMRLLSRLAYIDPKGMEWVAPPGSVIDGASIPPPFWPFIGGPFEGRYRDASVIHDVACDQKTKPWEAVHEAFFWAMRASGVESWRAKVMYGAVYHFGPKWPTVQTVRNLLPGQGQLALAQAKAKAMPGSEVMLAREEPVRTPGRGPASARADYVFQVDPPKSRLTEADFEKLKADIGRREMSAMGGMTLDEIRKYTPRP